MTTWGSVAIVAAEITAAWQHDAAWALAAQRL
jgi:hypothetical protein